MTSFSPLDSISPYDLGQPYFPGIPHFPTHPPFIFGLTKRHGDVVYPDGGTSAADAIALGTHVGTHIDALSHFSCNGCFFGGYPVQDSADRGMAALGIETIPPIARRAVVWDIARMEGVDALADDFEIRPEHLESAMRKAGLESYPIAKADIVLLRTGWARYFGDAKRFINNGACPGPGIEAARWLSARGIFAAGSDTVVFEKTPAGGSLPVHRHLLVESGIHIIEVLNLEAIATNGVADFLFIAAPMNIQGATGAPIRPLAFPAGARDSR
jgi:kynurenine formamidase